MQIKLKASALVVAVILGTLQLTNPTQTNPASGESQPVEAHTRMPPRVAGIFANSCNDCHSNRTAFPWYARVAPASWLVMRHVEEGRAELNFSEWGGYARRERETRLTSISAGKSNTERCRSPLIG